MSDRKSIIKSSKSKGENPRKRLSFAPDTEREKTKETTRRQSKDTSKLVSGGPSVLTNPACKMTTLGLYYDPRVTHGVLRQYNTTPMNQSLRHDFMALQNLASPSSDITADVLITGEKIFAEKLKMYILEAHDNQNTRMGLHITCEEDLPATVKAHIVLSLFFKDTHESLRHLSNIMKRCSEGTLSSKRVMILCVSSAEGCFKNVVDLEQFHTLLSSHQLLDLTMKEQGRLEYEEMHMILELIQKSVGYHRGTSLLMDYVMQLDLKNCFVEDIIPQDSALSITGN